MQIKQSKKTPVEIVVGLDFGTSTVKCIINIASKRTGKNQNRVLRIDKQSLFPSVVWEHENWLTIGDKGNRTNAQPYRSAKICLRCSILEGEDCRKCFEGTPLTAEVVCWAIISYCVNRLRTRIERGLPTDRFEYDWDEVEWKIGVPLDGIEQKTLYNLYRDIFWRAVHHGKTVQRVNQIQELLRAYKQLQPVHCPPKEDANCIVIPEAVVAANIFLISPEAALQPGLYYVCDAGAGTLDIAFFRYAPNAERQIVCYDTSSTRVGADSFADLYAKAVQAENPGISFLTAFEKAHQLLYENRGDDVLRKIKTSDYSAKIEEEVFSKFTKGRKTAFWRAFEKEKKWDHWHDLGGIIIGGAANISGVRDSLLNEFSNGNPVSKKIRPKDIPYTPIYLELAHSTPFHGIAYGLSIPYGRYYESFLPDEVDELSSKPSCYDYRQNGDRYRI